MGKKGWRMAHSATHIYRSEPAAHFVALSVDGRTIIFNVQKVIINVPVHSDLYRLSEVQR